MLCATVACVTVAVVRKLAGILHGMWVNETDFHVGFGAEVMQRLTNVSITKSVDLRRLVS